MPNQCDRNASPIPATTLRLANPYRLKARSLFIRLYSAYPDSYDSKFLRALRLPVYLLYAIHLVAQFYGVIRLKLGRHSYLPAVYEGEIPREFTIRDTNSQFHSIYFKRYAGCYEPDVSAVMELFLKPGSVFVDIGSNWGHHAFMAVLRKDCTAHLFESNDQVFADIERIADDLDVDTKLTAHNVALSSAEGTARLVQHGFESGTSSIAGSPSPHARHLKTLTDAVTAIEYETRVATLDSFNFPRIDLIKIDTEGAELDVLRGATQTLLRLRPAIVFEFHSGDLSALPGFRDFFDSMSYAVHAIDCRQTENGLFAFALKRTDTLVPNRHYNLLALPIRSEPGGHTNR